MQASEFFLIDTLTIQTTLLALYQVNICQGWKGQLYDVKRNAQQWAILMEKSAPLSDESYKPCTCCKET